MSNKTQPDKFEFEIVGDGYEWWPYKEVVYWANKQVSSSVSLNDIYIEILSNTTSALRLKYPDFPRTLVEERSGSANFKYKKLPYLEIELTDRKGRNDRSYNKVDAWTNTVPTTTKSYDYTFNTAETVIKNDELLKEYRILTE
jgi:hypothetical protein